MELVRFLPLSLDVTMEHDFMTTTINATATNAQSREPTRELTEDQLAQVSGGAPSAAPKPKDPPVRESVSFTYGSVVWTY
jgi:bacteriocin-like protein